MDEKQTDNPTPDQSLLARMDAWMAAHPWHPRVTPMIVYLVLLLVVGYAMEKYPPSYPFVYTIQCLVVCWLLWRYRKLTPELNFKFHWLAIPVGVGVYFAWIYLGRMMIAFSPEHFGGKGAEDFRNPDQMGPAIGWAALSLRLLGMSIVVPLFEELFIRSLMLRSLHRARQTGTGLMQVLCDLPMVGDWLMQTKAGKQATDHPPVFGDEFSRTPLGALSVFGVLASTLVFMVNHIPRDWPGTIACGIAYCLLLWATRKKGLGPVIWAHGITNALLWVYTIQTGDWQFL